MSGAEGWECTETDTVVFYSMQYSYRIAMQAAGRIDRLTTPYKNLYCYWLKSKAWIDVAISRAMKQKKDFHERRNSFKFRPRKKNILYNERNRMFPVMWET